MTSRRDHLLGSISSIGEQLQRSAAEFSSSNSGSPSSHGGHNQHGQTQAQRPARQRAHSSASQNTFASNGSPSLGSRLSRRVSGLERGITSLLTDTGAHLASPKNNNNSLRSSSNTHSWDDPNPAASSPPNSYFAPPPGLPDPDSQNLPGDRLPGYARRDPRSHQVATREYAYNSKSGKMEVTVRGAGSNANPSRHPIIVHDLLREVSGDVIVRLDKPEPVSLIRIRLKCVVNSCIYVQRGTARHPLVDELVLFDEGQTLWQAPSEDSRVHGTRVFPYCISVPQLLRWTPPFYQQGGYNQQEQNIVPPPSFLLGGNSNSQETVSVKYYLKLTLARQGILRPNERLFIPIIFLAHHDSNPILESRAEQWLEGNPLRSPAQDPSGWFGKRTKIELTKGVFARNKKSATFECIALLPTPPVYDRHSPIQYALKVKSTDPAATTRFPVDAVTVTLIQQASVTIAAANSVFANEVKQGQTMSEDGEQGIDFARPDSEGYVWSKAFSGSLELPALPPSFTAPRVEVTYVMAFAIRGPNSNNIFLQIPVKIYATSAPVARSRNALRINHIEHPQEAVAHDSPQSNHASTQSASASTAVATNSIAQDPERELQQQQQFETDLPPSYFEAISGEEGSTTDMARYAQRRGPVEV